MTQLSIFTRAVLPPPLPFLSRLPLRTLLLPLCMLSGLLALAATPEAGAQSSPWLTERALLDSYVRTNADFWLRAFDTDRGGFFTNVGRDGSILSQRGLNKDILTQSRNAYAMVRAFQMTGDETYLDIARRTLDFMYAHGWDNTFGGWHSSLSALGIPISPQADKTAFIHHYALLGPLAMWEATGSAVDSTWFVRGLDYNNSILWDDRPGLEGYFDRVDWRSENPAGKGFNATVDALTTHALQQQVLFAGTELDNRDRLRTLATNIQERMLATMPNQTIGFAEKYSADWEVDPNERLTIMGHVLKTAWVLSRLDALGTPGLPGQPVDPFGANLAADASMLTRHVLERGYDHEFGGPYKDYNRTTGVMQLYGLPDSTKAWWQMQQAVMAGLHLAPEPGFRDMAAETIDFFMEHFQDPVHGEVFADRTRRGAGIPQWGDHKGDAFKAGYHSMELAWYTLLYQFLRVDAAPTTIHYRLEPSDRARRFLFLPLEDAADALSIERILLDGAPFIEGPFTAHAPVFIPTGTGGVFSVTFGMSPVNTAVDRDAVPSALHLSSWPNPFQFRLQVSLRGGRGVTGPVHVILYDVLGRQVRAASLQSPGGLQANVTLETSDLASGMYLLVVTSNNGSVSRPVMHIE